jgi:hypothetical protein
MLRDEHAQVNPDELLPNAHPDLTETPHKTVTQDGWMVERRTYKMVKVKSIAHPRPDPLALAPAQVLQAC